MAFRTAALASEAVSESGVFSSAGDKLKEFADLFYPIEKLLADIRNVKKGRKLIKAAARLSGAATSIVVGSLVPTLWPKYDDYMQPIVQDILGNLFTGTSTNGNSTVAATDGASDSSNATIHAPIIYDIVVALLTIYFLMYLSAHATKEAVRYYHRKTIGVSNPENKALSARSTKKLCSPNNNMQLTPNKAEEYHSRMVNYLKVLKKQKEYDIAKFVKKAVADFRDGDATAAFKYIVALGSFHQLEISTLADFRNHYNTATEEMDLHKKTFTASKVIQFVNAHETFLQIYENAAIASANKVDGKRIDGRSEEDIKKSLQVMLNDLFVLLAYEIAELTRSPNEVAPRLPLTSEKAAELNQATKTSEIMKDLTMLSLDDQLDVLEAGGHVLRSRDQNLLEPPAKPASVIIEVLDENHSHEKEQKSHQVDQSNDVEMSPFIQTPRTIKTTIPQDEKHNEKEVSRSSQNASAEGFELSYYQRKKFTKLMAQMKEAGQGMTKKPDFAALEHLSQVTLAKYCIFAGKALPVIPASSAPENGDKTGAEIESKKSAESPRGNFFSNLFSSNSRRTFSATLSSSPSVPAASSPHNGSTITLPTKPAANQIIIDEAASVANLIKGLGKRH